MGNCVMLSSFTGARGFLCLRHLWLKVECFLGGSSWRVAGDTLRVTETTCRPGIPTTLGNTMGTMSNRCARSITSRSRVGGLFPGACKVPIIAFRGDGRGGRLPTVGINIVLSNNRTPNNRGIVTNLFSNVGTGGTTSHLCNFVLKPNNLVSRGCVRLATSVVSRCHGANNFSVVNSNHAGLRAGRRFSGKLRVLGRLGVGTLIVVNNSSSGAGTYMLTRCCGTAKTNIRMVNYPGAVSNSLGGRRVRASFNFSATYGICSRIVNGVRHSYGSTRGC